MARAMGRVIVKKVDVNGKTITNLAKWKVSHPNDEYFDSKVEWEVWKYIEKHGIPHKKQVTLPLFPGVKTQEFQQPRQTKKAKKEGRKTREIKDVSQKPISYTPDYYLPEFDTYIEVKGYADDVFKIRWKLFKLKGYKGFIVYSVEEFDELYRTLRKNKLLSSV